MNINIEKKRQKASKTQVLRLINRYILSAYRLAAIDNKPVAEWRKWLYFVIIVYYYAYFFRVKLAAVDLIKSPDAMSTVSLKTNFSDKFCPK